MKEKTLKKILLSIGLVLLCAFVLIPFIWMMIVSFAENPDFLGNQKFDFTLKNYRDVLTLESLHFPDYLRNSLIVAGIASVISVIIGALGAYAVTRFKFRGKIILVLSVLALSMFPQISIVGYLFKFMSRIGWINSYGALIFPYIAYTLPLSLWILLSYFSQIPIEMDEAAMVDGAGRFRTLFRVIAPVALPGFFSAVLLLFMFSFNEFLFALMLTSDHSARTVPVGIALFQGLHGETPWGYIMAASVISCIPVMMIALLAQRYIVQGLTGGALK